jgi:hypothetical protein
VFLFIYSLTASYSINLFSSHLVFLYFFFCTSSIIYSCI